MTLTRKKLISSKVILLGYIMILLIHGCNFGDKKEIVSVKYFQDEKSTEIFELDSLTSPITRCVQFFVDDNGIEYFALLNNYNNSIYVYNVDNKTLVKIIKFDQSHGIEFIEGFKILDWSNIAIVGRYNLHIADSTGIPYNKVDILELTKNGVTSPGILRSNSYQPIQFLSSEKLFIPLVPDIREDDLEKIRTSYLGLIVDFKEGNFNFVLNSPSKYHQDYYSAYMVFLYSNTFNPQEKKFILGFPGSHEIQTTEDFKNYHEYYAGSKNYGEINPTERVVLDDAFARERYYRTTLTYGKILFDPYRSVYYRIIHAPLTDDEFYSGRLGKKAGIIVLDNSFNKIDEIIVPDHVDIENIEVGRKGLYFLWLGNKDEDKLKFLVFTPKKS